MILFILLTCTSIIGTIAVYTCALCSIGRHESGPTPQRHPNLNG